MAEHNFGEKKEEDIKGVHCPVWQTPKYKVSKAKAVEMIDSGKYGLSDSDFWILMNTYAGGKKVMYTGLILSHNGCLKINERLDPADRFYSKYLTKTVENSSLIYEYNDGELYEVGEVSAKNCSNAYPYAMAFKRCYDRVVLKKSKLAFYGVYSEVEADEFREVEPRVEYANEEITNGTYRSWMDNYFVGKDSMRDKFLAKYGITSTDMLDRVKSLEEIDEIITNMKKAL